MSKRKTSHSGSKKKNKGKYTESLKETFRKSPEWKEFRLHIASLFNNRDYITGKKLGKGYNVHHLKVRQDADAYCDISDESNFIPLNAYSHKLLHYLFCYYRKDKTVLNRMQEVLDKMCELNNDGEQDISHTTTQQDPTNVKEKQET